MIDDDGRSREYEHTSHELYDVAAHGNHELNHEQVARNENTGKPAAAAASRGAATLAGRATEPSSTTEDGLRSSCSASEHTPGTRTLEPDWESSLQPGVGEVHTHGTHAAMVAARARHGAHLTCVRCALTVTHSQHDAVASRMQSGRRDARAAAVWTT